MNLKRFNSNFFRKRFTSNFLNILKHPFEIVHVRRFFFVFEIKKSCLNSGKIIDLNKAVFIHKRKKPAKLKRSVFRSQWTPDYNTLNTHETTFKFSFHSHYINFRHFKNISNFCLTIFVFARFVF